MHYLLELTRRFLQQRSFIGDANARLAYAVPLDFASGAPFTSIGFISFLDSCQSNHLKFPDILTVGLYELNTEISAKQNDPFPYRTHLHRLSPALVRHYKVAKL